MPPSSRVSLSQLIHMRDVKRKRVIDLFEEKKKIEQQMKSLQQELLALDEKIGELEERQLEMNRMPLVAVKQEIKQEQHKDNHQESALTMNPDEILTEPTQQSQHQPQDYSQTQDDPIAWTQQDETEQQQDSRRVSDEFSPLKLQNRKPAAKRRGGTTSGPMDEFLVRSPPLAATSARSSPPVAASSSSYFQSSRNISSIMTASNRCPYSTHDITQTLRQSFRLQSFRENQLEIIQTTLSGKDCFVLMKTGGGKSLLYQLPAVLESPKITLVVSPLLSLIQDQENQMNQFVPESCVSFTSGMGAAQHTTNWNRVRDVTGGVMMILVTPEKVFNSNKLKAELQKLEEQNRLGRFVIDECHCACQWGHDFRPDYAKISVLRQHFPRVPILAVTATASDQVRDDCAKIFQLSRNYAYFRSTANRPNLRYQVRPKESAIDVIEDMVQFIRDNHPRSAGIVYTYSKKDADTVADQLSEEGIVAESYHSEVSPAQKRDIHESWMRNETQVVVATIAFGLGINKPDVRFVLHHTLSKTLEAYYQESGRAGRDGKPSDCVLYYSAKDVPRMIKMINGDANADLFINMVRYAQQFGDDQACRGLILRTMGEPNQNLEQCLGLNEMVEKRDVTSHAVTVLKLLHLNRNKNMTMPQLIKEWRQNPKEAPQCVQDNPPGRDISAGDCERIIVGMLVNKLIKPVCRFTKYDTVVYLSSTPRALSFINSDKASMSLPLPKKPSKKRNATSDTATSSTTAPVKKPKKGSNPSAAKKTGKATACANSTISKTKKKRASSASSSASRTKASNGKKKSAKKATEQEVIDLLDDSDDESISSVEEIAPRKARPRNTTGSTRPLLINRDPDDDVDEESEFEFDE